MKRVQKETRRVLIVDNEKKWRDWLRREISDVDEYKMLATIAPSFRKGVEHLKARTWDLLVTDVKGLGGRGKEEQDLGFELAIRALEKSVNTLILSGFDVPFNNEIRRAALKGGCQCIQVNKRGSDWRHELRDSARCLLKLSRNVRKVFVCHGRDRKALDALLSFLRHIGLDVSTFDDVAARMGTPAPHAWDVLNSGLNDARAVIVLFTPDEHVHLRDGLYDPKDQAKDRDRRQARPNVLLEAGLCLGLYKNFTTLVKIGGATLPSNVDGYQFVTLDNRPECRKALWTKLRFLGCGVKSDAYALSWRGKFDASA